MSMLYLYGYCGCLGMFILEEERQEENSSLSSTELLTESPLPCNWKGSYISHTDDFGNTCYNAGLHLDCFLGKLQWVLIETTMWGSLACSRIKLGFNTQIFFILTSSPSLIRHTTEEIKTFNLWDHMNSFVLSNGSIKKHKGFMDLCVVGSWMSITNSRGWMKIYVLRIYWVMISREIWK